MCSSSGWLTTAHSWSEERGNKEKVGEKEKAEGDGILSSCWSRRWCLWKDVNCHSWRSFLLHASSSEFSLTSKEYLSVPCVLVFQMGLGLGGMWPSFVFLAAETFLTKYGSLGSFVGSWIALNPTICIAVVILTASNFPTIMHFCLMIWIMILATALWTVHNWFSVLSMC